MDKLVSMASRFIRCYSAGLLLMALSGQAMAEDSGVIERPVRIAIVNVATLLAESPQSKAANAKLKADYLPREEKLGIEQKAIAQLEEELATQIEVLPEEERVQRERELREHQRNYSRAMEDFREEVRVARDQAIDSLQTEIIQAIGEVRERDQIDIVLRESNYIVASDRIDITAKVMRYLEAKFQQKAPATTRVPMPAPDAGKQE
ncbi:OmpH family outer membrane protein [Thiothrix nivea]|uniref:Outer membrane chaperone Skp (OmpH) n=1 Tax=Thiothrix nivea (strain ATCC 35100 / DSM 5205 / JP2) TaxID=870187 RepID=A0A656HJR9_THINJ|nr:OmpH family outer membrane protein [Thiothrix nivea]EIJ36472.1 outer membrane chaperone Skp (OmpH) [Thiothrix nivea DSM 5205]